MGWIYAGFSILVTAVKTYTQVVVYSKYVPARL